MATTKTNETILNAIKLLINKSINEIKRDSTFEGRVMEVLGDNKYIVAVNGENYTLSPTTDMTFVKYELVWICAPQGNYSDKFILGRRR